MKVIELVRLLQSKVDPEIRLEDITLFVFGNGSIIEKRHNPDESVFYIQISRAPWISPCVAGSYYVVNDEGTVKYRGGRVPVDNL